MMRFTLFTGILLALTLTIPACGGDDGGGGPLGGLEGEATVESLIADDIESMCKSLGSKSSAILPKVSDLDFTGLIPPSCAVAVASGQFTDGEKPANVSECQASTSACVALLSADNPFLRIEDSMPSAAEIQAQTTAGCIADDWTSCPVTIDELTECSNDWTVKALIWGQQALSGLTELESYDCNKAMAASEETLEALIGSIQMESEIAPMTVPSCEVLLAKCPNNTMAGLATLSGDSAASSSGGGQTVITTTTTGGGQANWDGVPVISEQSCCESQPDPGCDNSACVECVCADDDFCCLGTWDNLCTSTAKQECADSCGCE